MANMNRLAIMAVLGVSLIALCGVASAFTVTLPVTVTVDTIQINGHYDGSMALLGNVPGYYGYTYNLFIPDGTYTVKGTVKNDDEDNAVDAWVGVVDKSGLLSLGMAKPVVDAEQTLHLKMGGEGTFELSLAAESIDGITVYYGVGNFYKEADTSGADIVNQEDLKKHTIDQGPMSNAVAIYSNGKLTYNGLPQFWAYI
jgi:hypothetical protein